MLENTYLSLFMAEAARHGDKIAVFDPASEQRFTYSGLDSYAGRIAAKMRGQGVVRGDIVVLLMPNSIDAIAAMFAAMKLGAAFAPLDPSCPRKRIEYICKDCSAKLVLTPDFFADTGNYAPITDPETLNSEDTAMLVYTSGSTGFPKGVVIDQLALLKQIDSTVTENDIFGLGAPFYFVAGTWSLFVGMANGCTCVLIPADTMRDPDMLARFMSDHNVTASFISPKVLRYFEPAGSSLRKVITGSERLSGIWSDKFEIYNRYAMSETMGGGLQFRTDRAYDNTPVGKPTGDVCAYILDENGCETEEGEICLTGHFAKGYLNLPEETARVFVSNPFRDMDGYDVMLRTHDLGRRLPDGNIVYIERADRMVKINGQRVEPEETVSAMRRISGISDAAVRDFEDESGEVFFVGYYVSETGYDEDELHSELSALLPDYMIPRRFVRLYRLPVNANGKLDRSALPKPGPKRKQAIYKLPENERQKQICEAFGNVLGLSDIGTTEDFFALGGDSIKVMMLQNELRKNGIFVSAKAVFGAHTPEKLALTENESSALAYYVGKPASSYPLTNSQLTVYLDCRAEGRETAYNNTFGLFLPAGMNADAEKLRTAAENILARYPILSSAVKEIEGVPSLVPTDRIIKVNIEKTEITDRKKLADSLNTALDPENGPLARASVFENNEGLFFVCVLHHIVADGTSVSIIAHNIAAAYNGEDIPAEGMSSFTLMQYEAENASELSKDAEVYRRMLDTFDGDNGLYPDDDPSLENPAGKSGIYEASLSDVQSSVLSDNSITEASLFMSAYAYMLRLFCNQENVLFFAGENGRHDPVLSRTVGMMVHNIPVLTKVDDNTDCIGFMSDMQNRFHELSAHDGADIAGLCGEYSIHPDCFFVYQGDMLSGISIDGRDIPVEIYRSDSVMASLTLYVMKQRSGVYGLRFEYAAEKFTEDTIKRMAEIYGYIVSGLCKDKKLADISLVSDEALRLMDDANSNEADYPVADIVSLFRAQVGKTPDNNAVIFKDESYTYSQTDEISERIAGKIRSLGIGRGDVVSVLIPRCTYMVTASLGILKSGAAYMPLDPSYPPERLSFMMQDADCKLLIADESLLERVKEYKGNVLLTKDIPELPVCEKINDTPDPSDLFVLLYTSGTTGEPKGVMLEHGNIANFCSWYREFYHLDENSRVAAYASYGFDASIMEIYPTLTTGACVCIADEEIRLDLFAAEKWFNRAGITHAFMTTQVGRQFYSLADVPDLKYMSIGGEKLVPLSLNEDGPDLFNVYGPTECTIICTAKQIDRQYARVPIGKPLANFKCYVTDGNGRRLPPLIPGELLIAGRGVGRGYLNRPDLTEKAFIRNPFCDKPGFERAYRSGDIVRLLPNGDIDFIGRNDRQVKVRGFRIELTETEGVIREFPGITDATVQVFENGSDGENYIAAYVVSPDTVDISAMNAFIAERKPPYMIPAVTMQIGSIPLNQNRKVNIKELPKPEIGKNDAAPPQNKVQKKISDCIAEVTGHSGSETTDDIFDAGLSSIGAIRLNVLLYKAFGKPVTIQDLRSHPTIRSLETFLSDESIAETYEIQTDYPLTQAQKDILAGSMSHGDTTIYNIPFLFRLSEKVDVTRLKEAVEAAIAAHPYLNARVFGDGKGEFRVRREDGFAPVVEPVNTEKLPKDLVTPFDILNERLYRAKIYTTTVGNYLFIELHRIVCDGSSMAVLLDDINSAYAGDAVSPENYTGYEIAGDEQKLRQTKRYDDARSYYSGLLSGVDPDMLPDGDANSGHSSSGTFTAGSDIDLVAVSDFIQKNKLHTNAFFNAVFAYVLGAFNGKNDVLYTTIYNGRGDARTSRTVTMLAKTIPVYCRLAAGQRITDFVENTGRQLVDSMSRDIYTFAEISRTYGISADVMFAYQGDRFVFDKIGGENAQMIPLTNNQTGTPLHIDLFVKNGRAIFNCEYSSDRFSEGFVRRFIACMERTAAEFTVKERLGDIELLDEATAARLDSFNGTDADYPETDIVSMFRKAAATYPYKRAIIYNERTYTYAQTDDITERIAGYLRSHGVGTGDTVSVMVPRCEYMPIASLGVLKAGAAYQPLDPSYPSKRLELLIKDAECRLLIADETLLKKVPGYNGPVLLTKDIPSLPRCRRMSTHPAPEDRFILICTSDTSGVPKSVVLEHRNISNFCFWYRERFAFDETCRMSAYAGYGSDGHIIDLYVPLTSGAGVYIVGDDIRPDLPAVEAAFNNWGITHSFMPSRPARRFYAMASVKTLRYLITGGEKLAPVTPRPSETKLISCYGPTECTVFSAYMPVDKPYRRIPTGKPIRNCKCYVVDKDMRRLPPLIPGELLIAGRSVGRGYLNRTELSEKVFIKNPFSDDPRYSRAYRSGDMVRMLPDGCIDFIGSNDSQVDINGIRIELTETEAVILEYPGITDVTVQAFDSPEGGKFIAAYIVSGRKIGINALNAFIGAHKPAYMIPAVIVQLDRIPLNPDLTVDKRALPVPDLNGNKPDNDKESSRHLTVFEEEITEVVSKTLGISAPGVTENLVSCGLTSMTATELATQLSKYFNADIQAARLLNGASVEDIENMIYKDWKKHRFFITDSAGSESGKNTGSDL